MRDYVAALSPAIGWPESPSPLTARRPDRLAQPALPPQSSAPLEGGLRPIIFTRRRPPRPTAAYHRPRAAERGEAGAKALRWSAPAGRKTWLGANCWRLRCGRANTRKLESNAKMEQLLRDRDYLRLGARIKTCSVGPLCPTLSRSRRAGRTRRSDATGSGSSPSVCIVSVPNPVLMQALAPDGISGANRDMYGNVKIDQAYSEA